MTTTTSGTSYIVEVEVTKNRTEAQYCRYIQEFRQQSSIVTAFGKLKVIVHPGHQNNKKQTPSRPCISFQHKHLCKIRLLKHGSASVGRRWRLQKSGWYQGVAQGGPV
jgi:hypothetical protein